MNVLPWVAGFGQFAGRHIAPSLQSKLDNIIGTLAGHRHMLQNYAVSRFELPAAQTRVSDQHPVEQIARPGEVEGAPGGR